MPLLLLFTQLILRLIDTANMEFVNMILHLVISGYPCVDCHVYTYLIIACISDISVKHDLKFYFMGIFKNINTKFCHLYIFQSRQKRKEYCGLFTEYDVARGILKLQCKTWEFCATSYSVKPLYYMYFTL